MPRPRRASAATPDDILAPYPETVRRLAEEVRALVRRAVPSMTERAYPGWGGIGFRDPQAGYVFGLFPQQDHLRLFFERGGELDDPDGLFLPAGDLRQGRYVEIRTVGAVKRPALREMIHRAVVHQSV